ncbi:MAG: hypothetical protein HY874_09240 [Chloroflexi bacterium]|nr:hypothetical protein [Chloroflexota bacterium]
MTCNGAQGEYIEAVDDLGRMARFLGAACDEYVAALRGQSVSAREAKIVEWEAYVETLDRLIGAQRRALTAYRRCLGDPQGALPQGSASDP